MTTETAAILALVLLGGYSGWVSILVVRRSDLETTQKALQIALIWLLPLFGAVVIHLVTRTQKEHSSASKPSGIEAQIDQGVSPRDFNPPGHD
jgi:hypothetical protein